MSTSNQLTPGMTISIAKKIYLVESCVKVTVAKGNPFIKTKLKDLMTEKIVEKNFKPGSEINEVALEEHDLEYLYLDGKEYLFIDARDLEQVKVPSSIIGDKVNFLKEGTEVKGRFYGESVFAIELPQFLELMIVGTEDVDASKHLTGATKTAVLETGAKVEVPPFVESGDIVKVDTHASEFIQRV